MEIILIILGVLLIAFIYSLTVASARPIPGSDFYKVSRDGRVLMAAGPKISAVRPTLYPDGLRVKLRGGARVGEFYVHELVAEVFLPNPQKLTRVRHRDGNVRNNRVENLAWLVEEPVILSREESENLVQT
ncbi:MAG: HNH endonuclease [Duganella sp.]